MRMEMKHSYARIVVSACLTVILMAASASSPGWADANDWHHPLYLAGHGYWRARAKVTVENRLPQRLQGRLVTLAVGTGSNELAIVGADARSIRVCDATGAEMLYRLTDRAGDQQASGTVAAGSQLVIPVVCEPAATADYFVYFDNRQAGEVPDFLPLQGELVNGDFEAGSGDTPAGWRHDPADPQRSACWTSDAVHSGNRSVKTIVESGAAPTWISTRQRGIAVDGGAKYRICGWVKAKDVEGYAGWYVHVGNNDDHMMLAPMLRAGDGTFDWKQVELEFTAPETADRLDLGTVLRGTGTAWFDDVELQCLTPQASRYVVTVDRPERCQLASVGTGAPWPALSPAATAELAGKPHRRACVVHLNFSNEPRSGVLLQIDANPLRARLGLLTGEKSLRVFGPKGPRPVLFADELLLFESDTPPRTAAYYYAYTTPTDGYAESDSSSGAPGEDALTDTTRAEFAALCRGAHNMVNNPSFEQGAPLPEGWSITSHLPEGVEAGVVDSAHSPLGKQCARLLVPEGTPPGWRGFTQLVNVRPRTRYLLAAWARCENVGGGEVRLHAHFHDAQGKLCAEQAFRSTRRNAQSSSEWTLLSGVFLSPPDAASMSLHFTINTSGTVWYDGAVVAEVATTQWVGIEGRPSSSSAAVRLWPVNPLVKVFPDEPSPTNAPNGSVSSDQVNSAKLFLARNEKEPLQLALRSASPHEEVRVEIEPPVGSDGAMLDRPTVGVVGFVPMDQASGYFRSDVPPWQRRVPTHSGHTDGWGGLWPDPILPVARFSLDADVTRPLWLTFAADKNATPGTYQTRVRVVAGNDTLAELPVEVRVRGFALPDESHVKAIYDVRRGPGGKYWELSGDEFFRTLARYMVDNRLCPDSVGASIEVRIDGDEVDVDFGEFDKAAAFCFDELKMPHAYFPWDFYLFGWGLPPRQKWGESPYADNGPLEAQVAAGIRPEFKKRYQTVLRAFWNHAKEKGWQDKLIFYISDEPFFREEHIIAQMKALCDMIHEVDPAIPIYSSTWEYVPEWEGYLDVWGVGHYGRVNVERMRQIREQGDRLWFTTDGQMCTDTPFLAIERLLPHYCFHLGAEAYEFWGFSWLTYDPYRFGWHSFIHQTMKPGESMWTRYPSGDGFLVYPGARFERQVPVATIRAEQAREGVEDYEYLWLLQERIEEAKAAGHDVSEAEAALQTAAGLVEVPNAGGRYSTRILPDPDMVLRVREEVARAIERLE